MKPLDKIIKPIAGDLLNYEKEFKAALDSEVKLINSVSNYLIKNKCKKIILGCTELPIAIFAYKSIKTVKTSKIFFDPNLILANAAMKKYKN